MQPQDLVGVTDGTQTCANVVLLGSGLDAVIISVSFASAIEFSDVSVFINNSLTYIMTATVKAIHNTVSTDCGTFVWDNNKPE